MKVVMKILQKFEEILGNVEFTCICLMLGTILITSFLQVILRNVFSKGIITFDVLNRFLVLWITLIAAAIATKEARHLNIEIINRLVPAKRKRFLMSALWLTSFIVTCFLARAAITFWQITAADHEVSLGNMSLKYINMVLPGGFILISFHFFMRFLTVLSGTEPVKDELHIQQIAEGK